nr:T9SS type A sorting domain-containing protein [Bacteroidota bacterium]
MKKIYLNPSSHYSVNKLPEKQIRIKFGNFLFKFLITLFASIGATTAYSQPFYSATDSVIVTSTNNVLNYGRGFRFSPTQDIYISEIGKRVPANATFSWVIWDFLTQTKVYEQVSLINSPTIYIYEATDSIIKLNSGQHYILEMYGSANYYYGASSQVGPHLIYYDQRYCNNCNSTTFPTSSLTNLHYGTPDFIYSLTPPVPDKDVEISNITTSLEPCYAANDSLRAKIKNTGTTTLDFSLNNLNLDWSISGAATLSGTANVTSGTLDPDSIIIVSLATGLNISTLGTYNISTTVTSAWDGNPTNNNTIRAIIVDSVNAIASVSTACLGNSVELSLPGYSGSQIKWQVDTGSGFNDITGATSNLYTDNLTGNSIFRAIYCSNDLISNPVSVSSIYVAPPVTEGDTACLGQNAVATAVSNFPVYWYDAPLGGNLLGTGATLHVNNLQADSIVYAQTEDGTALNCKSLGVPVELIVGAFPVITLQNDTAFCSGDYVILDPGAGASIFEWSTGEMTQTIQPLTTGTYTVTAFSSIGCATSDSVEITVYDLPAVLATASSTAICFGEMLILTGTGADFYTWNNNVSNGGAFNPASTATYIVTGIDANFCTNNDTIEVVVNPLPSVALSNYTKTCTYFTPFLLTGGNPTGGSYSSPGGTVSGNIFDPKLAGVGIHGITYTITDLNGCQSSANSSIEVSNCVGIDGLSFNKPSIKVYPNPTQSDFKLEINTTVKEEAQVLIFNLTGKLVHQENVLLTAGANKLSYNLEGFSRGVYSLHVVTNQHQFNKKVVLN